MQIKSEIINCDVNIQEVFDFLSDINHLEELMPKERIDSWQSTPNTCRFTIKNMASIGMIVDHRVPPNKIILKSYGENPFSFTLTLFMDQNELGVSVYFTFDASVNLMVKTMVQKPLKNFFDALVLKLPQCIEQK